MIKQKYIIRRKIQRILSQFLKIFLNLILFILFQFFNDEVKKQKSGHRNLNKINKVNIEPCTILIDNSPLFKYP